MLPLRLRLLKWFDRQVGRWLCLRATPTARALAEGERDSSRSPWDAQAVPPDAIERILVIRPGGIGDAVLTFPMIRALRSFYQGATIDVLGERRNVGVYAINDWVNEVFGYDRDRLSTLRNLAARRYDVVIDTEQYHHLSVLVANHLRPHYLCGFDTLGRGRFQTHRVRYTEQSYEVYSFLNLAAALIGEPVEFEPDEPFLEVDQRWLDWADEAFPSLGERPLAVIVPSASSPHRYWPPPRYAQAARWLVEHGFCVVVLGGADAVAAARVIAAENTDGSVLNLTTQTSLPQTAAIVKRARLYLSADTGALHIAYGVGTPTVHMFGSGIQEKWAPRGRKYVVVNKSLPCSPCTRYGETPPCSYGVACMDAITTADVTGAIEEVLRR